MLNSVEASQFCLSERIQVPGWEPIEHHQQQELVTTVRQLLRVACHLFPYRNILIRSTPPIPRMHHMTRSDLRAGQHSVTLPNSFAQTTRMISPVSETGLIGCPFHVLYTLYMLYGPRYKFPR